MDPLAFDVSGNSLDSNVSPLNVITKVDHLNKTVLDYTEKLINEFENQGYANNEVIFSLPYDWRKDLDSLAQNELKTKIDSILSTTRSTSIDIIAHSQGGLLIKRLLYKQPDYQAKINKLVFVGTPNLGAPKAAKALLYGDSMGVDFLGMGLDPEEIKRISQNTPSVYELLPSLEYFSHGQNYFAIAKTLGPLITGYSNLNYTETKQYLKDSGLNNNLIELAETFHTSDYDNYNFSTSGIKVSNIAGCQKASISQILAGKNGRFWLNYGPGDGTVPLISASNIFGATSYFAKNSNHGVMLTEDGTRQLIVNIISGSDLDTGDKITENSSECRFNGRQVSVHSPVELHIYDENGNHFGPSSNGNFDVQIPGVEYDILGEDKFAFLPEGQNYTLKLIATGSGTFDFYSSIIEDGQFMTKTFYNDVIITDSSQAVIDLSVDDSMNLDMDGNGVIDKVITYSSRLDAPQADDLINPSTTVDLDGVEGEPGYYRSDVSVNLTGVDDSSGILNTNYSLDGGISFTKFDSPLIFPSEGQYKLIYFSTDKAGNDEEWKFVDFVIDKTPPEFIIKFDLNKLDLSFSGKDEISDKVLLTDEDDKITVLDQAGNQTVIKLKEKDRKKKLKAEIVALEYNHIPTDISKTSLKFNWSIDKKTGSLRKLEQHIKSKQDFNIEASFNGNRTLIKGKDETGKIAQIIPGLYLLHINTHQGDFGWQ